MLGHPSAGAILVPGHAEDELEELLDEALRRKGYRRRDERPPPAYALARDEWLGAVLTRARRPGTAREPLGVVLLSDVGAVFRVARWLSEARPELPLGVWQRLRGASPTLKLLQHGRPQWKDGEDPDLEVDHPVPREPPAGILRAEQAGLPPTAGDVAGELGDALRAHEEAVARPELHERFRGWIHARSALAP